MPKAHKTIIVLKKLHESYDGPLFFKISPGPLVCLKMTALNLFGELWADTNVKLI